MFKRWNISNINNSLPWDLSQGTEGAYIDSVQLRAPMWSVMKAHK